MIWWIVTGVVVIAVVVLVLVVLPVLRRLPGLRRAAMKIRQRAVDTQELQNSVSALQERLAQVSAHVEATRDRAAEIRNPRPDRRP
ncbi:hypothetical protein GCM10023322_14820 [Rugosimonospora acidiphila]|uniref:Uncharacterized protein n=1 Tax=Rugosimonospora acidiphila TaxID=556531 RepID=A0ABP9RMZ6_9ACTN